MPFTFKNSSISPSLDGFDVLYTCPPATSAVAMSALATSTISGLGSSVRIGIAPAGTNTVNWLANSISIASGSSVNLLAGKVSLAEGDRLIANNLQAVMFAPLRPDSTTPWTSPPIVILSNADGSIIVAKTADGISVSTDGALTSRQVVIGNIGGDACGTFFGGYFWFYTSSTTAQRSSDGMTWTTVAVTNAPQKPFNNFGSIIIKDGGVFGVAGTQDRLTSSTDGITWTLGDVLPNSHTFAGLAWTGTHWVASHITSTGTVYRSTNGTGWASVDTGAGAVSVVSGGIAAIGGTLLASFNGVAMRASYDHGATWSASGIPWPGGAYPVYAVGGKFIWRNSSNQVLYSTAISPVVSPSVSFADSAIGYLHTISIPHCIAGNRWMTTHHVANDISNLSRNAGMTVTASVVEVS